MKIGSIELENRFILGPMAGVTDLPFRLLCKEQGAALLCMEMVSAKGIYYANRKTEQLLAVDPGERPVSLQLFGSEPELMAEIVRRLQDRPFDIIDLNMGCPVPKIVNNGEGSALMKDPLLAGRIIEAMAGATNKPVTVKIRKGFDEEHVNAPEIAYIAQESGAAAVTVHGRTREQFYAGKADWDIIRRVKERVRIPVIGNGDLFSPEDALRMEKETGCDGFMIARGAQGNPWIFRRMIAWEKSGEIPPEPEPVERFDMMLRHARMLAEFKGEYIGMREMRKHAAWYTAGLRGASELRCAINSIETMDELRELLSSFAEGKAGQKPASGGILKE